MDDDLSWNRQRLVAEIKTDAQRTADHTGRAVFSQRVLEAIGTVPREKFVPEGAQRNAYANRPLSIGHGQTISQPYIVALMTDLLNLRPTDRVLEIGTGCGYQTAVLAELAAHVFTVELIPELQMEARDRLEALGYRQYQLPFGRRLARLAGKSTLRRHHCDRRTGDIAIRFDRTIGDRWALTGSGWAPARDAIPYPYSAPGRRRA